MVLWTHEKDQEQTEVKANIEKLSQLLGYFHDLCKSKGNVDWKLLAERIGGDATPTAVRQHVQKLKYRKPSADSPQTPTKSGSIRNADTNTGTPTKAKRGRPRKGAKENVVPAERTSPAGDNDKE